MRLLVYELRKVWARRVFWVCLAVLASANLFLLWVGTRPTGGQPPASVYKQVGAALAPLDTEAQKALVDEKLATIKGVLQVHQLLQFQASGGRMEDMASNYQSILDHYGGAYRRHDYELYTGNLYQDYALLTQIKAELDTVAAYPEFLQGVQQKAEQLAGISIFNTPGSGYDQENIARTARVYAGMDGVQIRYAPQKGLFTALDYQFTDVILLAAMLLLASVLVRQERDGGLLALVRSMPGGRLHTALAKLAALALSLLAVVALLYGVNLAYCQAMYGLGPLGRSIQSVPALMRCTMRISVLQYLGRFLLAKWAAAFAMGLWVMLAALAARHVFAGWAGALALPLAQWLVRQAIPATSRLNVVKYANLASLLRTNELLGNYRNLYWFDTPVALPLVEWAAVAGYGLLFGGAFCWLFSRGQLLAARPRATARRARRTRPATVPGQEARKLFLLGGAGAVLAAFLVFQCWQGHASLSYIDADEIYYAHYMKQLSGPYDQEAYEWVQRENQKFEPLYELQRLLTSGRITGEQYAMQMSAYYGLARQKNAFDRAARTNVWYAVQHPPAQLVYESGYEVLLGFTGQADIQDTLLAGLVCAVCFAGLFAMEQKGGMQRVLWATPLGRAATVKAKLRVGAAAALLAAVGSCVPRLWQVLRDYGLPAANAPALSLREYSHLPAFVTLSDVLLLAFAGRLLACLAMGGLVLVLSQKLGNALSAMFVGSVCLCVPCLLALCGMPRIEWLGLYPLFHLGQMLTQPGQGPAVLLSLALAALAAWACREWLLLKWLWPQG